MAIEGRFDRHLQIAIMVGLENVPQRFGYFGPVEHFGRGVRGQIDEWQLESLLDHGRGLDAVHVTFETDVHQDHVGQEFSGLADRFRT